MNKGVRIPFPIPRMLETTKYEIDGLELVLFVFSGSLPRGAVLTAAETHVVELLAHGYSTSQIAAARGVSYRTVANQLAAIYRRAALNSRAELLGRAHSAPTTATPSSRSRTRRRWSGESGDL